MSQQLSLFTDTFRLTTTGLEVTGTPDYEDWMDYGVALRQLDGTARQFAIGDWIVHGFDTYEHGKWEAVQQVWDGIPYGTLREYERVAKGVKSANRLADLSWTHHHTVAALDDDDQCRWLRAAAQDKWSVARLRQEIEDEARRIIAEAAAAKRAAEEEARQKHVHVSANSGNNEWYTPPQYIEAARAVMGGIDCDPASSDKANETVRATTYYTAEMDGLGYEWPGRVWMNPPYAKGLVEEFATALVEQLGDPITQACVLVNNATETGWFQMMLEAVDAVCFLKGRVKYLNSSGEPENSPLQGQAVLYFGDNVAQFAEQFSEFGRVLYAVR